MPTMTLQEADRIVGVIVAALQAEPRARLRRKSLLRGYDLLQCDTALKLDAAAKFAISEMAAELSNEAAREQFQQSIRKTGGAIFVIEGMFVDDALVEGVEEAGEDDRARMMRLTQAQESLDNCPLHRSLRQHLLRRETVESFIEFCRQVGASDPLFWQKVYTRLELDYAATAPAGPPFVRFNEERHCMETSFETVAQRSRSKPNRWVVALLVVAGLLAAAKLAEVFQ